VLDDRTAPKVAAICRRLDGIPLALEMAAARVPLLGIEGLANRLDERFRVLTAGKRTALPRQRTLHATLDLSHGLLSAPEAAVFRRLGVFAGPFTLAAAGAVAIGGERDGVDVIECLSGLCDKSLVVADPDDVEASYRLLETARAYAQERLAEAGETAAATRCHAHFYRRVFEACFDDWTQLSDAAFRARYAPHLDNLRAAIAWSFGSEGDGDTAIALVGSSAQLWLSFSLYAEGDAWIRRAQERLAPSTPPALEADLWLAVARFHGQRNQQATIMASRRAADLYGSLGDALHALGSARAAERDDEAEPVLLEARALLERTGRPRLVAMAHGGAALFHAARGRPDDAYRELRAALELHRVAGADGNVLSALGSLADGMWMRGDLDRAIRLARDALEQHRQSPFSGRLSQAYAAANLFGMLVEHRDLAEAQAMGRRLLPELRELGIAHGWTDHYASWLARSGSIDSAVRLIGWADALRLARGLRRQPNEERARDATLALARAVAPAVDVDRWLAEGAALSEQDALGLARS
jgi:predicted ATPase